MSSLVVSGANLYRSKLVLSTADVSSLDTAPILVAPGLAGKILLPIQILGKITWVSGAYTTSGSAFVIFGSSYSANKKAFGQEALNTILTSMSPALTSDGIYNLNAFQNFSTSSALGEFAGQPLYLAETPGSVFTTGAAAAATVTTPGTGYAPGDTGTITTGSQTAEYTVLTVNAGAVLTVSVSGGNGVNVGGPYATSVLTGGGNSALALDVTRIAPSGNFSLEIDTIYQVI